MISLFGARRETSIDWLYRVKVGKVVDVDIATGLAYVRYSDVPNDEYAVVVSHPLACTGDQSSDVEGQRHPAWGVWAYPSVNSIVLVYHTQNQLPYIIATMPPKYGYSEWAESAKLKMNRVPIAADDKRKTDKDRRISDDLLKWGEIFMRSVGLADIMLDYKGNVIIDSSKQVTIRIGDRDSDNKIASPDVEVSFGNILTTGGTEKTYGGQAIKAEIVYGNAFIRILENGQVNVNGNLTVDT